MIRNHASGGESVRNARSPGRRHSAADSAPAREREGTAPDAGRPSRSRSADNSPSAYPMICVQADTQLWNGTQSFLPFPHWASGVFQNFSVWK